MTQAITRSLKAPSVPALVAGAGERATYRFLEFFTAQIRNPNTRRTYARNVGNFLNWLECAGVRSIADVSSVHVAAYVEVLGRQQSAPSTKQSLAAICTLFDWLATGGVLPFNPVTAVRGPKQSAKAGKTPVLEPAEARQLFNGATGRTPPLGSRNTRAVRARC